MPLVPALTPEEEAKVEEAARTLVDKYMRQCAQAQVSAMGGPEGGWRVGVVEKGQWSGELSSPK